MPLPKLQTIDTPHGRFMSFVTDFGVSKSLQLGDAHEPELIERAVNILKQSADPGLLVDIGAHIGTFCIPVARATGCKIYAFEAQPVISQILGANLVMNGIDSARVENVYLAPASHPATATVPKIDYTAPGNFGAFTWEQKLTAHVAKKMKFTKEAIQIRVAALDEYELEGVRLIKLDVEGAELHVLKGSLRTLERNGYPPLIFESWTAAAWASNREALLTFVANLGYDITNLGSDNLAVHKSQPQTG